MKRHGIPLCFYPTTVMVVDDERDVLFSLDRLIDDPCKLMNSPYEAMHFFDKGKFTSEMQSVITAYAQDFDRNTASTHVDISQLHHLLYNADRFEEVSVMLLDYDMPKMDGLDIARIYHQQNIEIIMLTAEADVEIGLSALNQELIERFIYKGKLSLNKELLPTIKDMQFKHFLEASHLILGSLLKRDVPMPSFFQNDHFAVFFKGLLKKHAIIEYYVLDYQGDFILLDRMGKVYYLTLRDDEGYYNLCREAEAGYYDEPTDEAKAFLDEIKNKKKMPFLWGIEHLPDDFWNWPVYPVTVEVCNGEGYWYALLEADKFDRGIDYKKIKPYKGKRPVEQKI